MGNKIGIVGNRRAKIMKIDGEIFKIKIPAKAMDVLKDYPEGYVLLESESVKRFGIRAPQLRPEEELKPKKVYFLVEIPKFPEEKKQVKTRKVNSEVGMGRAMERLEGLMSRQKSAMDLGSGLVRVKMRVPRGEIERLMEESKDEAEVAERIVHLCLENSGNSQFQD